MCQSPFDAGCVEIQLDAFDTYVAEQIPVVLMSQILEPSTSTQAAAILGGSPCWAQEQERQSGRDQVENLGDVIAEVSSRTVAPVWPGPVAGFGGELLSLLSLDAGC